MSLSYKPLSERLKMTRCRLDDAFLKFANAYIKYKVFDMPGEIFHAIEKVKKEHPLCADGWDNNTMGQIFWDNESWTRACMDVVSEERMCDMTKDILIQESLLSSIGAFRRLLLEHPLQVFYTKKDGSEVKKLARELFSSRYCFSDILAERFGQYQGHPLYIDLEAFNQAIDKAFMSERESIVAENEDLKRDKNAYCMHVLFGLSKYKEILDKFPDDKSYTEDGEVVEYLKKVYGISQYNAARMILPSLKTLKM